MEKNLNDTKKQPKLRTTSDLLKEGWIPFAQVGRPHGLKGAFFLKTEDRRREWNQYKSIFLETPGEAAQQVTVVNSYKSGDMLALQLEELTSRSDVERHYLKSLFVHRSEVELEQEEYLVYDLVGLKVIAEGQGEVGTVKSVSSFGAQDNLEIELVDSSRTVLFPFIDAFIKSVNKEKKTIEIVYAPEFFEE